MIARLGLLFALVAGMAQAQDCAAQWNAGFSFAMTRGLATYEVISPGTVSETGDWCRVQGVELFDRRTLGLFVDDARWQAQGFAPDAEDLSLTVLLDGMRIVARSGEPWTDHMLALQSLHNPHVGEFSVLWNPLSGDLGGALRLAQDGGYEISVTYQGGGFGQEVLNGDATAVTVDYKSLSVTNNGTLDGFIFGLMSGRMSQDPGTPAALFDRARADARGLIDGLPPDLFGYATKGALRDLVADMPVPRGTLTVTLDPQEPISLAPFLTLFGNPAPEALVEAAQGAKVQVHYARAR